MSLLKNQNYLLLRTGWSISDLGSQLQNFAFSLYVLSITGSAVKFSVTLCMQILPMIIFAPLSGYVADRLNRKIQIILYDLLSSATAISFFMLYELNGTLKVYQIYLCVVILSILQTFFRSVATCLAQTIVDPADYTSQKSLDTTLSSFTLILAPALAGVLFGFSSLRIILLINVASFLISAAMEALLRVPTVQTDIPKQARRNFLPSLLEGFHYIRKSPFILSFLFILSLLNFILPGVEIGVTVISKNGMHLGSATIGIENSVLSIGLLAGAIFSGLLGKRMESFGLKRIVRFSILITAVAFLTICLWLLLAYQFLPLILNVVVFVSMNLVIMMTQSILSVNLSAQFQRLVPNEMMGRVNATVNSIIVACAPLGQITAGLLMEGIPYYIVYLVEGLLCFLLYGVSYKNNKKTEDMI